MTTRAKGGERLGSREWANEAIRRVEADANRSADTHLHVFPLPTEWGIDLYLKDESVHPTGSLKHRLARSLFLYGLCNGWISERTTVVDASTGSTAVSEAYFARFLGLPFVAVMPASTSPEKIALIEAQGGSCHLVDDPTTMDAEARRLAAERDGHFLAATASRASSRVSRTYVAASDRLGWESRTRPTHTRWRCWATSPPARPGRQRSRSTPGRSGSPASNADRATPAARRLRGPLWDRGRHGRETPWRS